MEVFKVFANLSLKDMISSPLEKIKKAIQSTKSAVVSLRKNIDSLALAMAPLAAPTEALLEAFAECTVEAIGFESTMMNIASVIALETTEEIIAFGEAVKDLSGRIPVTVKGINQIITAASQAGIAKQDLIEFTEHATKIGVAFNLTGEQAAEMMANLKTNMNLSLSKVYSLADAVSYLSSNMNTSAPVIEKVLKNAGNLGVISGLTETQVAALGSALLSVSKSPETASDAMKNLLSTMVQGESMSKKAASAFAELGYSVESMANDMQNDAQGTIFKVLEAIADKPKELQTSLLADMFGESSVSTLSHLIDNMNNLSKAFELVANESLYAESVQKKFEIRTDITEKALLLLTNKINNLKASVGDVFSPTIAWAAKKLGILADAIRWVVETPFGNWIVKIIGALALFVTGTIALSNFLNMLDNIFIAINRVCRPLKKLATAFMRIGEIVPMALRALAPLKAVLAAISWPIALMIAAVILLYIAYKNNFCGIADIVNSWGKKIKIVFTGVISAFKLLNGAASENREELEKDIKAAGLENLVAKVANIKKSIQAFLHGLWKGLDFSKFLKIFEKIKEKLSISFEKLGKTISKIFNIETNLEESSFAKLGEVVGGVLTWSFELLATGINAVINCFSIVANAISFVISIFTGDWQGACQAAQNIWSALVDNLMSFADLFCIGDWIRDAWGGACDYLSNINLFESGAKLLDTLKEGIISKFNSVKDSIVGFFGELRDYLPFSDAKKGPFSELTLSGSRLMTTLADGVKKGSGTLLSSVTSTFSSVVDSLGNKWDELTGKKKIEVIAPEIAPISVFASERDGSSSRTQQNLTAKGKSITINIDKIILPNAKDGKSFLDSLDDIIAEYGGGVLPI